MTFAPPDDPPQRSRSAAKASGSKTRTRSARPSRASLRKEIDAFVVFLNGVVAVVAPYDALDSIETAALVQAIDEEATRNARFRRGLEALLNVTSGGSLWMVVGIIAARRVARHGIVGPRFGPVVDDGGAFVLSTINAQPSEAAETMENIISMFRTVETDASSANAPDSAANGNGPA